MNLSRLAGGYAVVAAVLAVGLAVGVLAGPFRAVERSDYMTYHVAARIILAGNGDCLYELSCQADAQRDLIGHEPTFGGGALPFTSPPWLAALVTPLGWLSLPAGFALFTLLGLAVLTIAAWRLAPGTAWRRALGPILIVTAWPTVMAAIRGQSTLLAAGLLALSVGTATYRSGAAMGLAMLKPTLVPLWGAWQLLSWHPRAVITAVGAFLALAGLSVFVVGPHSVLSYPGYVVTLADPGAAGVHVEAMMNWRGAADRLGAGAWLVVAGSLLTLAAPAYVWITSQSRRLAAGAAFLATPLVIPHANQQEAILAGLGVLLVVTAGLPRARLVAAAVLVHAFLWIGPLLDGRASGWLLFAVSLGWLAAAVALARGEPKHG
jgi:hypothetical protein